MDFGFSTTPENPPRLLPALIVITVITSLLLNVYGLGPGIAAALPDLFFIPLILCAYYYPRRGVFLAVVIAISYLAVSVFFGNSGPSETLSAITRSCVFILIAAVVSYLSGRMYRDTQKVRQLSTDYKAIIDNTPAMIWYKDTKNTFIRVNPAGARAFGMPVESIEGRSCHDLFPDFAEKYYQDDIDVIGSGNPRHGIIEPMTTSSGEHLWIQTDKIPLRNENGTVTGILVFGTDITGRKHAEDALRESEEKYRAFFITSMDSIFITTMDGRWVDFNDATFELLGYESREEMQKTDISHIYADPRDRDAHIGYIREHGYSYEYPVDLKKKNGSIIHALITTVARKDANGIMTGFQGSARDITGQRKADDALRLANRKLSLLSGITRHDINNQLMALNAYIELSRDAINNPDDLREYIAREQKIAEVLAEQVRFSRDYDELGVKSPSWQDVDTLIREAAAELPLGKTRLEINCPGLEVYADPLLVKVFYNLIDNSLHYGGDQMTTIRVTADPRDTVLLIVFEDNGTGISAGDKSQLFTKGFGRHTGLGLFLSREILSITGIAITETGKPGTGARFEIVVPEGTYRIRKVPQQA